MTIAPASAARRARRLVRWFPRAWRERYEDEFCALLEDRLADEGPSIRVSAGVALAGVVARLGQSGIAPGTLDADEQARASLAWVVAASVVFLASGLAVLSQLLVAWQWSPPRSGVTTWATVAMSTASLLLAVLAAAALTPVVAAAVRQLVRGARRRLVGPFALLVASATALVLGARHFENGWPGTGGHHWALQGIVPGGVAAFAWASTLSVSSYWAHPGALGAFPATELAWMAASPIVIAALGTATASLVRRVELSAHVLRYELRLAQCAAVAMAGFLVAAIGWLADGAPRRAPLFHVGAIDVAAAVVMSGAVLVAHQAVHRGLGGRRPSRRPA